MTTRSFATSAFATRGLRRVLVLLGALIALGGAAFALDPDRAITQYVRESWTERDGAPSGMITGITQTPNGYLWLGTETEGLVRFDGIAFVRTNGLDLLFGQRVDRISSLLCSRDGALWVGTIYGLARLKDGQWTAFDRGESKTLLGLHESPNGDVWYTRHWEGLYRVSGETLTPLPLAGKPRFVTTDARGTMWVAGYEGLWRLAGEERRFYSMRDGLPDPSVTAVYADHSGSIWAGSLKGLTLLRDDKVVSHFTTRDGLSDNEVAVIYRDRDGVLWVGTASGGLNRQRGERFESLTKTLGLTSNRVTAIYDDREGSLWVGTAGGLNRLRNGSLVPISETEGLSPGEVFSIAAGADGSVFLASGFGGLAQIPDGQTCALHMTSASRGPQFDGPLFASPDGGLWSGQRDRLTHRLNGRTSFYPVKGYVTCIGRDAQGIVFATGNGELFRLVDGKAERYRLANGSSFGPELLGIDFVWMTHLARDGTFWVATSKGVIAVRDGRARQVWRSGTRNAKSLFEDEQGTIWVATHTGVVRIAGESVTTFTAAQGLPYDDLSHVLADRQGGIWMSSARGIFRIKRQEFEAVAAGKAKTVSVETFGVAEGMRTVAAVGTFQPAGCATRDGRLWFTTTDGVVVIDPARIQRNTLPPPVVVEAVLADGKPLGTGGETRVPAGTQRLAIHYNGLSLLAPEKVRFKYRLEGFDRDWVDAEGRRVAYYTKLPPGLFNFHVIAANNDGVWNDVGASLKIRQLPYFYQTAWFLACVALALVGSAFGLYWLRVRQHIRAERELQERVTAGLAQIKTLSGLLPVCAWCKKVRDDGGYWSQIEEYVSEHTQAEFSH